MDFIDMAEYLIPCRAVPKLLHHQSLTIRRHQRIYLLSQDKLAMQRCKYYLPYSGLCGLKQNLFKCYTLYNFYFNIRAPICMSITLKRPQNGGNNLR